MSDTENLVRIDGGCHCGNIRFAFSRPAWGDTIQARACGCSFCQKHGGLHTSHPQGRLDIRIADDALVQRYRFGTKTAEFYVCKSCGVEPLVTSEIDGTIYAAVSARAFEGIDPAIIEIATADFDGEGTGDRLARRKQNWIGRVSETLGVA